MLIEGSIPLRKIEDMSVTFSSQFLGAFPKALSPLGALALSGTMRTLVEDSSTKTNLLGSTPPRRLLQAPRASSSRSAAPSVFFVGPPQLLADRPAHRGDGHPHASGALPQLAVARKRGIVVLFKLLPGGSRKTSHFRLVCSLVWPVTPVRGRVSAQLLIREHPRPRCSSG